MPVEPSAEDLDRACWVICHTEVNTCQIYRLGTCHQRVRVAKDRAEAWQEGDRAGYERGRIEHQIGGPLPTPPQGVSDAGR